MRFRMPGFAFMDLPPEISGAEIAA